MAAPYRDTRPRIDWSEVIDTSGSLLSGNPFTATGWAEFTSLGTAGCTNPTTGLPYSDGSGTYCVGPTGASSVDSAGVVISIFVLFDWNDDHAGHSPYGNPARRDVWQEITVSGFTPGDIVGMTVTVTASLYGNSDWLTFFELIGTTTERFEGWLLGPTLWTFANPTYTPVITNNYLATVVPGSGDITMRCGLADIAASGNAIIRFTSISLVALCTPTTQDMRLDFPYPIQDVRSFSRDFKGSQKLRLPSGEEDAWQLGSEGVLKGEVRWIPAVTSLALPYNDGWEDVDDSGTTRAGWDRFIRFANAGGTFEYFPDKDDNGVSYPCSIDEPFPRPELEDDMVRSVPIAIRTLDGSLIEGYSQ